LNFGNGCSPSLAKALQSPLHLYSLHFLALVGRKIWQGVCSIVAYHRRLDRALAAVARQTNPTGLREGNGIWLTEPINDANSDHFKTRLEASKVLVVANAKPA
jgi:hypothetical protein